MKQYAQETCANTIHGKQQQIEKKYEKNQRKKTYINSHIHEHKIVLKCIVFNKNDRR